MKNKNIALCVLVKYPCAGNVKTRLAKSIGSEKAVALYYKLLMNTINQLSAVKVPHIIFAVSSDLKNKHLFLNFFPKGVCSVFYKEKSLNFLLKEIFDDFLDKKGYKKALVMCSDSPFIVPSIITEAYNALDKKNTLFISPSSDGGYSLVGLNNSVDIFSSVVMSTNEVLKETLSLADSFGLNIHTSCLVDDIDTVEDIYKLTKDLNDECDPSGAIRRDLKSIIEMSK